jgi:hypothetical protein
MPLGCAMSFNNPNYRPEPSKLLTSKGIVVSGSFFVARGIITLIDDTQLNCLFEVAQMQDGICWAVVYLTDETIYESIVGYLSYVENVKDFSGQSLIDRENIIIKPSRINVNNGHYLNSQMPIVCDISEYSYDSKWNKRDGNETVFFSNLFINEVSQSIKTTIFDKLGESRRAEHELKNLLKKAIEEDRGNNQSSKIEDIINPLIRDTFEKKTISFQFNNEQIAIFYPNSFPKTPDERSYPFEPLSSLKISNEMIPDKWTATNLADWIFGLLSLARGETITWLSKIHLNRITRRTPNVNLTQKRFLPFIEGVVNSNLKSSQYDKTVGFVQNILANILQKPFEEFELYLYKLYDYIFYSSTAFTQQQLSTLLCALYESVVKIWEDKNGEMENELTKENIRALWQALNL